MAQVVNEKERLSEKMLDLWQSQEAASARFLQNDKLFDELRECTNETSALIEEFKDNTTEEIGFDELYIPFNVIKINGKCVKMNRKILLILLWQGLLIAEMIYRDSSFCSQEKIKEYISLEQEEYT